MSAGPDEAYSTVARAKMVRVDSFARATVERHRSGAANRTLDMPTKRCMDVLTKRLKGEPPPILVVMGDDEFLRQQAISSLREWCVGADADDMTMSIHAGDKADFRDVMDELRTPPFLGDKRLVIIEEADKFVTAHREELGEYFEKPSRVGILLLSVRLWAATTKLAKVVESKYLAVEAKTPQAWHVASWCVQWAPLRQGKKIDKDTADWLVELIGPELGLLDQELAKLATFVGEKPTIDLEAVNAVTAGTRAENVFKLLDLAIDGQAKQLLVMLDRLFTSGESPVGILAMLTSQLRKLTRAARLAVDGARLDQAARDAGIAPFAIEKSIAQLRHFGRPRMAEMYRQLLRADLDVKGGSALDPKVVVERLLLDLSRPAARHH